MRDVRLMPSSGARLTRPTAARKDRLDMVVSIALGSASQIALFVAPALVLLSHVVGPTPMNLQFWPGAVTMVMIATVTATFITTSGRSAWFVGALMIFIYVVFALTLVPPAGEGRGAAPLAKGNWLIGEWRPAASHPPNRRIRFR